MKKKGTAFLLILILAVQGFYVNVNAEDVQYRLNLPVIVNGSETCRIAAFDDDYENNLFISVKGLAHALSYTGKAFSVTVENKKTDIVTGADFQTENTVWSDEELHAESKKSASKHELYVNGAEKKHYSFIFERGGENDAFFTPISISMMLDVNIDVSENGIEINTDLPCELSMTELEKSGYLDGVNALLVGDGSSGEIFYEYSADEPFPIASTTKLMTYYVFMDLCATEQCSIDGYAVISETAARLSESPDGTVKMAAGISVPVTELLYGMLLPSSNECAYVLSEYAAGSEAEFVKLMNEKAESLGLLNAHFNNCHGLPDYDVQFYPAKRQNVMTAEEMFKLVSNIMSDYPQVTDITSTKLYHLDALSKDIKNTNSVLYNMDNAVGLKTGTTNRAGACLVTCVKALKDGEEHNLITVLLGAEDDFSRGVISEFSSRFAMKALDKSSGFVKEDDKKEDTGIPADPEMVVRRLIKVAEEIE